MTTRTTPSDARMITRNLKAHSQVCLATHKLLGEMGLATSALKIFNMTGISYALRHNNLLTRTGNTFSVTDTGSLVLRYIYPTNSEIKQSEEFDRILGDLNQSEKAYLVAKAIFKEIAPDKIIDGFFKMPVLLKQLQTIELLNSDDDDNFTINGKGMAIAILICREL